MAFPRYMEELKFCFAVVSFAEISWLKQNIFSLFFIIHFSFFWQWQKKQEQREAMTLVDMTLCCITNKQKKKQQKKKRKLSCIHMRLNQTKKFTRKRTSNSFCFFLIFIFHSLFVNSHLSFFCSFLCADCAVPRVTLDSGVQEFFRRRRKGW